MLDFFENFSTILMSLFSLKSAFWKILGHRKRTFAKQYLAWLLVRFVLC